MQTGGRGVCAVGTQLAAAPLLSPHHLPASDSNGGLHHLPVSDSNGGPHHLPVSDSNGKHDRSVPDACQGAGGGRAGRSGGRLAVGRPRRGSRQLGDDVHRQLTRVGLGFLGQRRRECLQDRRQLWLLRSVLRRVSVSFPILQGYLAHKKTPPPRTTVGPQA